MVGWSENFGKGEKLYWKPRSTVHRSSHLSSYLVAEQIALPSFQERKF
jgi:hypothetical protein